MNQTTICLGPPDWPYHSTAFPSYYSPRKNLIDGIPDSITAVSSPLIAYWTLSMFFHFLDMSGWKWLEKYRIHESEEVTSKNLVSRSQVLLAVIVQQAIQTALGLLWIQEEERIFNHAERIQNISAFFQSFFTRYLGDLGRTMLPRISYTTYCILKPMLSYRFIIDTWQYFLHRLMHTNKFLYRHFHSWHHRLYVPYAFGSSYNHPLEGLLLESLGAGIAEKLVGFSTRQAIFFFVFATFKGVDDHCGYSLPFDPFQLMTGNNAAYHAIHHQVIGIKFNYSQPFFMHWDVILGTRLTHQEADRRRESRKRK
ncbi:sphingosine hydroxylase [Amanita rubescens]|nr:sphingosine hydroxylase [Amanita rubescens]